MPEFVRFYREGGPATAFPNAGAKFALGEIGITRKGLDIVPRDELVAGLNRHQCGDWGEVPARLQDANEASLKDGKRVHSCFVTQEGLLFFILTEEDRSKTRVLVLDDFALPMSVSAESEGRKDALSP